MSLIRFNPISWFEDSNWKTIQVIGRLENSHSVYIRVAFRPYFTVRYNNSEDVIDEHHAYLMGETPVAEVKKLDAQNYRIYTLDRDDYFNSLAFYEKNGIGEIVDKDQEIKSKFFAERQISPGSWQQAYDLKTLAFNVTNNSKYTSADLEYFTYKVESIDNSQQEKKSLIAFFDIEAIPSDDVSFPDAEADEPPDNIFAISLIYLHHNFIFILSSQNLPHKYLTDAKRTITPYDVNIVRANTEKEMLTAFFNKLAEVRPDRLVSFNGRRFDLNYLGEHSRKLGIELPAFTKILNYQPYFYPSLLVQKKPFPMKEEVMTLRSPSISQIDLLDFYRRIYPQLGNHKLETISRLILGRGKTGLSVKDLFTKYRRGSKEDLLEIIDYSIVDSLLLRDLWETSQIENQLSQMASFWRNDAEYVLTHELEDLFDDLIRAVTPNIPLSKYPVGKPPGTERKSGIHRDVYLYSLSDVYLTALEQINDPLANVIANYFKETDHGLIPFKSGYFPVSFENIKNFINTQIDPSLQVWSEENSVAVKGLPRTSLQDNGPVPYFPLVDYIPLIIIANKSWILIGSGGLLFKKGLSSFVRPPFKLIEKYVDVLIQNLLQNRPIEFPQFEFDFDDYVLDAKVTAEDFANPPPRKEVLIQQLRELKQKPSSSWRRVKYIQTVAGPVIEEIYMNDPRKYIPKLDVAFYNSKLESALKPILH